ncbi:hypothetical protein Pelo_6897 [Pelomyxa schiedti]|nr:hypothetical protein Pelo_6897 [Pelomyxa schiedti]
MFMHTASAGNITCCVLGTPRLFFLCDLIRAPVMESLLENEKQKFFMGDTNAPVTNSTIKLPPNHKPLCDSVEYTSKLSASTSTNTETERLTC